MASALAVSYWSNVVIHLLEELLAYLWNLKLEKQLFPFILILVTLLHHHINVIIVINTEGMFHHSNVAGRYVLQQNKLKKQMLLGKIKKLQ